VKIDSHEHARRLVAWAGPESLANSDQAWLQEHMNSCAACRDFGGNVASAIHALRAIPFAADGELVSSTQLLVRRRALELQRHRERLWMVCIRCTVVTVFGVLSTIALWRGFAWLGAQANLAPSVWQVAFLVLCATPALVAGVLLLVRDTHLADHVGSYQG
jgi:predicted anti-sigma-YlaC factor YlaD